MYWFPQPCQQYFLISMVCKYFYTLYFKLFCSIDLWCACHAMIFYQSSASAALVLTVFSSFLASVQQFSSLWTTIQVARCYRQTYIEFALKIMCLAGRHIWFCIRCIQTISSTQPLPKTSLMRIACFSPRFSSMEEAAQLSFFPSFTLSSNPICSGIPVVGG